MPFGRVVAVCWPAKLATSVDRLDGMGRRSSTLCTPSHNLYAPSLPSLWKERLVRICTTGGGGLHARLMLKGQPIYRHCRRNNYSRSLQLSSCKSGETLLREWKWSVENARVEPVTAASSRLRLTSEGQGNSSAFSGDRGFWGRTTCSRGAGCGGQDMNLYA